MNYAHAGKQFVRHVVPAVMKPARTLWHEVFGFLFLALAVLIGGNGLRFYLSEFDGAPGAWIRMSMTAFCVILFGSYGISGFRRARKISRS